MEVRWLFRLPVAASILSLIVFITLVQKEIDLLVVSTYFLLFPTMYLFPTIASFQKGDNMDTTYLYLGCLHRGPAKG